MSENKDIELYKVKVKCISFQSTKNNLQSAKNMKEIYTCTISESFNHKSQQK